MNRVLAQVEVEQQILDVCDALDVETHRYSEVADLAADAEADYKLAYARAVVGLAAHGSMKMTAADRQARAELSAAEQLRVWKIADARRAATKEALLSLRARLDALRTLNASIRNNT